ncbi:50S ribosomal protein L23 [Candidatus Curtissbacteria bacterium RBG_13_40_7]|uniref:Large ribosomal subunit protein uL23 n=1 Tax=Candidatus Curtissbacteria bacterium RBG_13_40_7 TaxID=1797706 RepID=A0A1F5FVH9_9BACT|nr:MAG: 50S ribosomal protein L23 [Candidatus Curtissbacteria bacterium RBG_13_40_7]
MREPSIIQKAILSEKAYKLMEKGAYIFLVTQEATKEKIAKSVAGQFSVKVKKVNIVKTASKRKRIGRTRKSTLVGGGKKAIVWLEPGQTIAMLSPKSKEKSKSKKKEKEAEKVQAEGKEL